MFVFFVILGVVLGVVFALLQRKSEDARLKRVIKQAIDESKKND